MKFEDLTMKDVRMLSFHENRITAVLAKDRIETFTFKNRDELKEAVGFGRRSQTTKSRLFWTQIVRPVWTGGFQ